MTLPQQAEESLSGQQQPPQQHQPQPPHQQAAFMPPQQQQYASPPQPGAQPAYTSGGAAVGQSQLDPRASSHLITLDVGGKVFKTRLSSLLSYPQTYLGAMVTTHMSQLKYDDPEGTRFFLDRNGDYFGPILDFYRTGEFVIPSALDQDLALREAQFFRLPMDVVLRGKKLSAYHYGWLSWQKVETTKSLFSTRMCDSLVLVTGDTNPEILWQLSKDDPYQRLTVLMTAVAKLGAHGWEVQHWSESNFTALMRRRGRPKMPSQQTQQQQGQGQSQTQSQSPTPTGPYQMNGGAPQY